MTTLDQPATAKAPTHAAFMVRQGKGGKGFFTRIGSGWANKDGQGFNLQIDAVPLDGQIVVRVSTDKKK